MEKKKILDYIGRSLYHMDRIKEQKRYWVFRVRCKFHKSEVDDLLNFFDANEERQAILQGMPALFEQTTRGFFYKDSTWGERVAIVKNHFSILEEKFKPELMAELYTQKAKVKLWEDVYQEKPITVSLWFHAGQRKEGCLSLVMEYEGEALYQIMFWLDKNKLDGKNVVYVGALQGPQNGNELIKGLTKAYFGYRTKNLMFYALRSFAKTLGIENIYAVSNDGYYAMNHVRKDRKLKTDFGAFWQECEGSQCSDRRFYIMPVAEHRKSMEELKPSKRAQHRRRFAKMDEMEAQIAANLSEYML